MSISHELKHTKITNVQLDLFGFCNAACWYCPVKYIPQPKRTQNHMSLGLVEKILVDIDQHRKSNGIVDSKMKNIYTAHYGEVLLYKHFDQFLQLLQKYDFTTTIFSNGVNLTPSKINTIKKYNTTVSEIVLNIPSFEPEIWARRSGFNVKQFDKLISNLELTNTELANNIKTIILINGVDDNAWKDKTRPGNNFGELNIDTHPIRGERFQAYKFAKRKFDNFEVYKEYVLHDRAGLVSSYISNQSYVEEKLGNGKVIGCNGYDTPTDRTTEWIHINSLGETFLCCNDYNMDYVFGNLSVSTLTEIWGSAKHIETIMTAREQICRKCYYAKVEE